MSTEERRRVYSIEQNNKKAPRDVGALMVVYRLGFSGLRH
jgi:hypothetical protein